MLVALAGKPQRTIAEAEGRWSGETPPSDISQDACDEND
jgi:hypothetical protein